MSTRGAADDNTFKASSSSRAMSTSIPPQDARSVGAGGSSSGGSSISSSSSNSESNRRRSRTEGHPSHALRFLERSDRSPRSSTTTSTTLTSDYPVGYVAPQTPARARAWTVQPSSTSPSHNSSLSFLVRTPTSTSVTPRVDRAGLHTGMENLGGGFIAVESSRTSRSGVIPRQRLRPDTGDDADCAGSSEDEDDNVCPSIIFSCFPCLACLRPGKRRRNVSKGKRFTGNDASSSSGFGASLNAPLLSDQTTMGDHPPPPVDFPKDLKLIEVEVQSARNVPPAAAAGVTDAARLFVSLRMTPVQEGVGEQAEDTSLSTGRGTVNPRWGARETFTFFVTDSGNSNANAKAFLQLHLLYRPLRPPPPPSPSPSDKVTETTFNTSTDAISVGEGFVDILGLFPSHDGTHRHSTSGSKGNSRRVAVPMRDPVSKRRTKCLVMLGLRYRRVNETIDTREDRLYEYQMWSQFAGWSSTGTPRAGKWSTMDGVNVSDSFIKVAPPAGEDSEVVLPWCPFGGWEYSKLSQDDWEALGVALDGAVWTEGYASGEGVTRRRLWRRVFLDNTITGLSGLASLARKGSASMSTWEEDDSAE